MILRFCSGRTDSIRHVQGALRLDGFRKAASRPRVACIAFQHTSRHLPNNPQSPAQFPIHDAISHSTRRLSTQTPPSPNLASPPASPTTYTSPTTGILSLLPKPWIPYAELIRLDKPAGTIYLFFPCLFSTLLAATHVGAPASSVLGYSALFFSGALIMRGAGCTVNDLWDRNLDPHVERTKFRPLARKAITPFNALVFTGAQMLTGLAILLQFPLQCLYYGVPSLILVTLYPLAKRVTHYPQFVLGLAFSWGAIMGFPALGVDLLSDTAALQAAALLYASCTAWTVLYDMIYAHMDLKDDLKVGIKSIAVRHERNTKAVLTGLAVVQTGLLGAAGWTLGFGPLYYIGACGSAALTLGNMIRKVDLKSVKDCWWWFVNGAWITGGGISLGMALEYFFGQNRSRGVTDSEAETP